MGCARPGHTVISFLKPVVLAISGMVPNWPAEMAVYSLTEKRLFSISG
jgi:hypothetical protein